LRVLQCCSAFHAQPRPAHVLSFPTRRSSDLCGRGGRGLLVRPFANVSLKAGVHCGEFAPMQGWISPEYGRREPSPVLIYSTVTRDRKSTRLNSSHQINSYADFCVKKKQSYSN